MTPTQLTMEPAKNPDPVRCACLLFQFLILTDDGKGRIEGDIGEIGGVGIDLAATAHTIEGIEHART